MSTGEQSTLKLWLEVVAGETGPELTQSPVSDAMWKTVKRDIFQSKGVLLEEEQRILRWTGPTARILYTTLSPVQKGKMEATIALDMGENSGKIIIQRTYRDVLLDYEAQYT